MNKEFFICREDSDVIANKNTSFNMIDKWIEEGEVSGTDHYIGPEYHLQEYLNLIYIRELIRREL